MYILGKYWNNYIGDSDDSLTLIEYLAYKNKEKISLEEIFEDLGLNKLDGNFRQHDEPIKAMIQNKDSDYQEQYLEFYYPIDIIVDIVAILLECKKSGTVNLLELFGGDLKTSTPDICILRTKNEEETVRKVLEDFVANPLEYDLSEMCPDEDMLEMATICGRLFNELFGE